MSIKREVAASKGGRILNVLSLIDENRFEKIEEIRLRADKPCFIKDGSGVFYLNTNGILSRKKSDSFIPKNEDILEYLRIVSGYSLSAFQEEIKNGYLTIRGGHRIGICAKVIHNNGVIKSFDNFSSINIRISHEVKGCAVPIIPYIKKTEGIYNAMIISPPGLGKTTLLRDMVRIISNYGINISVVDERGEIAGMYMGKSNNDLGDCTDILDNCPKKEGMLMLLRSMSPEVIVVDEIGKEDEVIEIRTILSSGVNFLCSVHGNDTDDVKKRLNYSSISDLFERFIELKRIENNVYAIIKDNQYEIIGKEVIR